MPQQRASATHEVVAMLPLRARSAMAPLSRHDMILLPCRDAIHDADAYAMPPIAAITPALHGDERRLR